MSAASDDVLLNIAPNIIADIGTPSDPILPDDKPQYVLYPLYVYARKTQPIGKDTTKDLIGQTKSAAPFPFLVKNYYSNSSAPGSPLSPPPPSSSLLAPKTTSTKTPTTKDQYPPLPDDLPFDEIGYGPKDLLGVAPPGNDPLMKSMIPAFNNFPSAVYIDDIKSCISTPYWSPENERHRNGVMGNSTTTDQPDTTYLWQTNESVLAMQRHNDVLEPRPDGTVKIIAQSREDKTPYQPVYLDPGKWEKKAGIKNGDSINAFSLVMAIVPGTGDAKAQAAGYSIKITFGDVTFEMFEGNPEATVTIKENDPPKKIMIKPTSASQVISGFGPRAYVLSFIPVWNGLLISDGVPGSSDWADSVRYVGIENDLDINKAINDILYPPPKTPQDTYQSGLPPQAVVQRNGKKYQQPGVRVTDYDKQKNSPFKMGTRLTVTYSHCGGPLKFVPLYFPQFSRFHLLVQGAADPKDLSDPVPWKDFHGVHFGRKPLNQNVFLVPSATTSIYMPIFSYGSQNPVDFRTHLTTIVFDRSTPYECLSMEFKTCNPEVRCPIQVWAGMTMDTVFATQPAGNISNKTGYLSVDAIDETRIRSVSISRSLDGSSGDIVWDRFDPLTQDVDSRPIQEVGAIQINALGGANTVPGTIFTGIAYGNAEEDQPGENLVKIPLKGIESKLSSEGGLGLMLAPAFDGYDHRDAMTFMAIYGGFALDTTNTTPFQLLSAANIQSPAVWFPQGTPLLDAMNKICELASTLYYFDRFGTCIYISVETSTGVDWNYPDLLLENFSDEPDSTWVRNMFVIFGMVNITKAGDQINIDPKDIEKQMKKAVVILNTYPKFAWSKMAVYTIPVMVKDSSEITKMAVQISKGQSRPRSSARCRIPGNAKIELLDTINKKWLVTSISQQLDLQRKTWSTDIGVELFIPDQQPTIASVKLYPPGTIAQ